MKTFYKLLLAQALSTLALVLFLNTVNISKSQVFIACFFITFSLGTLFARHLKLSVLEVRASFLGLGIIIFDLYQLFPTYPTETWRLSLVLISLLFFACLYITSLWKCYKNERNL